MHSNQTLHDGFKSINSLDSFLTIAIHSIQFNRIKIYSTDDEFHPPPPPPPPPPPRRNRYFSLWIQSNNFNRKEPINSTNSISSSSSSSSSSSASISLYQDCFRFAGIVRHCPITCDTPSDRNSSAPSSSPSPFIFPI